MTVYVHDEAGCLRAEEALPVAIEGVLAAHGRATADITLALRGEEEVRALNRQFRGEDRVTDVLSFSAGPAGDGEVNEYLGDIVIAYPYVLALAQESEWPLAEWLLLLAVHGTLHLLGYTHEDEATRTEMWRAQAGALAAHGVVEEMIREALALTSDRVSQ